MESETRLELERSQIVEAMDWIDAERKRLSRFCFSETRQKWHGERERGRRITLMKKQSEWLYRRRCGLRERIGQVNSALKELRRARNGSANEAFASAFVEAAREKLPEELFSVLMDEAARRFGGDAGSVDASEPAAATVATVLDELTRDMEAFMASNERQPPSRTTTTPRPESQADFGIGSATGNSRIFPALAGEGRAGAPLTGRGPP